MPNTSKVVDFDQFRKRLIALIHYCTSCEECRDEDIADHLIANGVTIQGEPLTNCQQWIPVTERLPENDYGKHWKERARYNVLVNGVVATATFGYRNRDWWVDYRGYVFDKEHYNEVTHWQLAPEPPKEVKPFHYEKGNQPHGAEQFAKACAVCVNNGSTLCKDCKTEKKSGFEPPF